MYEERVNKKVPETYFGEKQEEELRIFEKNISAKFEKINLNENLEDELYSTLMYYMKAALAVDGAAAKFNALNEEATKLHKLYQKEQNPRKAQELLARVRQLRKEQEIFKAAYKYYSGVATKLEPEVNKAYEIINEALERKGIAVNDESMAKSPKFPNGRGRK